MNAPRLKIVILGLSITSSWGNGHATTYRGLVRELSARDHDVLFLERDVPWYAANRDLPEPPFGRTELYSGIDDLKRRFTHEVRNADFVMVGSYVPEGVAAGDWVTRTAQGLTGFYDIDTPVTLEKLSRGDNEYVSPQLIPRYGCYLSFAGGPLLRQIEERYGSRTSPLYCSVDQTLYFPEPCETKWDMGYLGTYSDDRQPALHRMLLQAARLWPSGRFAVAGPQYPDTIEWPPNVERIEHLPPDRHRGFYNSQRFTLNTTRSAMARFGYAPSVRLFEAAACGVPIISDYWNGLEQIFDIGSEILLSRSEEDTLWHLREIPESERIGMGERARQRVLAEHTAARRAEQLETHILDMSRQGRHVQQTDRRREVSNVN